VHEAVEFGGFGGEIVAQVVERCWGDLKQPPMRIGAPFCPIPYSEPMESFVLPQAPLIADRIKRYLS
jgi:pyruvate/2-oxoglutarate/acetoin dehydrogenase E1 component